MNRRCPYCNQILPEYRLGVRLPALKARIYDLVLRSGVDGIAADDLEALAYNGAVNGKGIREDRIRTRKTLHNHIHQINELIVDQGYRIVGRSNCYRLMRLGG